MKLKFFHTYGIPEWIRKNPIKYFAIMFTAVAIILIPMALVVNSQIKNNPRNLFAINYLKERNAKLKICSDTTSLKLSPIGFSFEGGSEVSRGNIRIKSNCQNTNRYFTVYWLDTGIKTVVTRIDETDEYKNLIRSDVK
jgi:hypothetical protein